MADALADPDRFALAAVQQYLQEHGYVAALAALEKESGLRVAHEPPLGGQLLQLVYAHVESQLAAAEGSDAGAERRRLEEELLSGSAAAGPVDCPSRLLRSISGLHLSNIIAITCWPCRQQAVTGSSDGSVHVLGYDGSLACSIAAASSGVLALALQGGSRSLVAAGCMDGGLVVLDGATGAVLACARPHRKYVVACKWAPDGRHLVTGAWDESFAVHRLDPSSGSSSGWKLVESVYSAHTTGRVNDVVFLPGGSSSGRGGEGDGSGSSTSTSSFLVAVQGSNYLRQLSITTSSSSSSGGSEATTEVRQARRINMNAAGDDHVSFSAAHLAVSPCGRLLLVSADNGRLVVYSIAGWFQVRSIIGLPAEQFHQFSAAWHRSGHYIMAAAAHGAVCVYHLGSAKRVATVAAHTKNVRGLSYDGEHNLLLTCSFDRSVKVFEAADAAGQEAGTAADGPPGTAPLLPSL